MRILQDHQQGQGQQSFGPPSYEVLCSPPSAPPPYRQQQHYVPHQPLVFPPQPQQLFFQPQAQVSPQPTAQPNPIVIIPSPASSLGGAPLKTSPATVGANPGPQTIIVLQQQESAHPAAGSGGGDGSSTPGGSSRNSSVGPLGGSQGDESNKNPLTSGVPAANTVVWFPAELPPTPPPSKSNVPPMLQTQPPFPLRHQPQQPVQGTRSRPVLAPHGSKGQHAKQQRRETVVPPAEWGYAIVDPLHPCLHRVPIAPSVVSYTIALAQYNPDVAASSAKPCTSTACMKFFSRDSPMMCPLGTNCPNFHVEHSYLEAAREVVDPICCALHNDFFTNEVLRANSLPQLAKAKFTLVLEDRSEMELDSSQVAFTVGLEQLSTRSNGVRVINAKRNICRLHREGRCKWTKDCGHVHVCRKLLEHLRKFHYPSFYLLLLADQHDPIVIKLHETPEALEFLRSDCARPLIASLLEQGKSVALKTLGECGVPLPPECARVVL